MKLGILIFSNPDNEKPTGVDRLEEAARVRGHDAIRLYEPFLSFRQTESSMEILHRGTVFPHLDVILCRPNFIEEPSLHMHTVALLKRTGVRLINGSDAIAISKNKLTQFVMATENDIPMPASAIVKSKIQAKKIAQMIGYPIIVKVAFGTHGKGVFFAADDQTLGPIVDYLGVRDQNPVLVQKCITEARGEDLRAFVIDGEVIASMELTASPSEWRSNAGGGSSCAIELTQQEKKLALLVTHAVGLEIAGVDLIRSNHGPLFLEINANPGFAELEKATGIDVAGKIVEYVTK